MHYPRALLAAVAAIIVIIQPRVSADVLAGSVSATESIDARRSNQSSVIGPTQNGFFWKVDLGANSYVRPSVGVDGTVYATTEAGKLFAVSPAGSVLWSYSGTGSSFATPAIATDGTIYYAAGRFAYAINPNGSLKWQRDLGLGSGGPFIRSPLIDGDGRVHFSTFNGHYALDPADGTNEWSVTGVFTKTPSMLSNGDILIARDGLFLRRLTPTGTQLWQSTFPGTTYGPTIATNDTIYMADYDGNFYVVDPLTGNKTSSLLMSSTGVKGLSIGADGAVYAASDSVVYKLVSNAVEWGFPEAGGRSGPVLIDAASNLFVAGGQLNNTLFALAPDGTQIWSFNSHELDHHFVSPVLGPDGTLYATNWSYANTTGYLYALPEPGMSLLGMAAGLLAMTRSRRSPSPTRG